MGTSKTQFPMENLIVQITGQINEKKIEEIQNIEFQEVIVIQEE
jgi:hypothetical protein